jgi:exodeoxyribonuclease VII small subunit
VTPAAKKASPAAAQPAAAQPAAAPQPDVSGLSYEAARDALLDVVRRLESGGESLEESLALWERGEALAAHCESWLDGARRRIDEATGANGGSGASAGRGED